ncbi:peptidylprolyl isomerase [Catellatospora sp. KI3]|uniref:peptidylprolyl isomerase n=1 Tax=Catellatospora sp. KI3 TaxID=3041620 RepID=UPI0024829BE5|nr:peptidylprolyl isomerase [Catellatospora sp. KI3]MDI1462329.1 peptidylprolyl isomerase [Catellatospora sp. KI3]
MASSNTRQRKLARAKVDRQLARRAETTRRSRQLKAVFGGLLAIAVVAVLGMWSFGVFDAKPAETPVAETCTWDPRDTAANTQLTDVGKPAANGMPTSGTSAMTIAFNSGNVVAKLDRDVAPCAAASLKYLADAGYYNNTKCHEITRGAEQFALRCGDKSESGNGGAAYGWYPENQPAEVAPAASADPSAAPSASASAAASAAPSASPSPAAAPRYKAGTIAMQPTLTGSQFLIFYQDSNSTETYSIVGEVTDGLDVIKKIAEQGAIDNGNGAKTKPKKDVVITTLTVVDSTSPSPSAPASPQASASVAASPKPTASASTAS